jgi:hypothetical protein
MPRTSYLPPNALQRTGEMADAVVFTYDTSLGGRTTFGGIGFHGTCNAPDFHYTFRTGEAREKHIQNFIACRVHSAEYKAKRKIERQKPHPLTVGTILHTCWGYDQTNVEYFEVTRVISDRSVELRELAQKTAQTSFDQGTCKPIPGKYLEPRSTDDTRGQPIIRRARPDGSVRIDSTRDAWIGGGERNWSTGH